MFKSNGERGVDTQILESLNLLFGSEDGSGSLSMSSLMRLEQLHDSEFYGCDLEITNVKLFSTDFAEIEILMKENNLLNKLLFEGIFNYRQSILIGEPIDYKTLLEAILMEIRLYMTISSALLLLNNKNIRSIIKEYSDSYEYYIGRFNNKTDVHILGWDATNVILGNYKKKELYYETPRENHCFSIWGLETNN